MTHTTVRDYTLNNLLYFIPKDLHGSNQFLPLLEEHPEIRFVSLAGVDLSGNATDERIPIRLMTENLERFLSLGVQTDGSSVVLQNIATLNDAKVILLPDRDCTWFVDYNFDHPDEESGRPVGTLLIPAFLIHNDKKVCSRSILQKSATALKKNLLTYVNSNPHFRKDLGLTTERFEEVDLSAATELEFWVKTPEELFDEEKLFASQKLKEQYWKRTKGNVRTAMEHVLLMMERFGLQPEMGHKEVGGVLSSIDTKGHINHVMEQLEIDWSYDSPIQAIDNERLVKDLITEVFNSYGLEVTFLAKPIEGVAGSGKHLHISAKARLSTGQWINLFSLPDLEKNYMSTIGFSSLMGILKNYEVINPFVTATNDAFHRLKPGFEAPICIVSSLGQSPWNPSRNRSILIGLIKDLKNPKATRFELRSPNAYSNTYLVLAACYEAMWDGIHHLKGKSLEELEAEFSKEPEAAGFYLEANRQYRSEEDVFEKYNPEERQRLFGKAPATVYDNMAALEKYPDKVAVLTQSGAFTPAIIDSYRRSMIGLWKEMIQGRILEMDRNIVRRCVAVETDQSSDIDVVRWNRINALRWTLMKDTVDQESLFTRLKNALNEKKYEDASLLQVEIQQKILLLKELYSVYSKNLF